MNLENFVSHGSQGGNSCGYNLAKFQTNYVAIYKIGKVQPRIFGVCLSHLQEVSCDEDRFWIRWKLFIASCK